MALAFLYDPLFYSTVTSQSKACNKALSERRDVIEKAVLRSIKRFYLKEFKKDNKSIVRKRFKQATASAIIKGFKKMCRRLFGDISNLNEISEFLMIISSIKPTHSYPFIKSVKSKADLVNSVMYKYSRTMVRKILKIKELGIAFKYIYENHPEFVSKSCKNKDKESKNICNETLNQWMEQFTDNCV